MLAPCSRSLVQRTIDASARLVAIAALAIAPFTLVAPIPCQTSQPNIVFLFADDLGWTDLSGGKTNRGNGSDYYKTPHLDALAARGMSFDHAYTCGPNCAPTRAALMSGQYSPRTGMYTVNSGNRGQGQHRKLDAAPNRTNVDGSVITLAETLRNAGYATGHFGKWHLGNDNSSRGPRSQGFQVNAGGTGRGSVSGGSNGHFAKADGSWDLPGLPANGKREQYMAERLTDEALGFMNANRTQPFFAYLTHFSVHTPIQAPAADRNAFNNVPKGRRHKNQTYAGMMKNLDDQVGRVVRWLETTDDPRNSGKKLIANTLVLFYSDNGGVGGYADAGVGGGLEITHQFPLKSGKGSLYEGGIRVPLIVRWDGRVKANSVQSSPVTSVDLYPTLTAIAGGRMPGNQIADGENLLPILLGQRQAPLRTSLFWHFPGYLQASASQGTWRTTPVSVIRRGDWKAHFYYETRSWQLYDLSTDIGENRDVAANNPFVLAGLGKELRDWLVTTRAPLPRVKGTTREVPLPDVPKGTGSEVDWQPISTSNAPSARAGHALATDGSVVWLHGGDTGTAPSAELWRFDGTDWQRLQPSGASPAARSAHVATYDRSRSQLVVFGGRGATGLLGDTWVYDGVRWQQRSPSVRPSAREGAAMCYDSEKGRTLLMGGRTASGPSREMWAWNGSGWSRLADAPTARAWHSMSFDSRRNRAIVFGGIDARSALVGEPQSFQRNGWMRLQAPKLPPARRDAAMAYDVDRDRLVLYGGSWLGGILLGDTWELDGVTWIERKPRSAPPARVRHAGAFVDRQRNVVLFGGARSSAERDTWRYVATAPADAVPFGSGCRGTAGAPTLMARRQPWLGDALEVATQRVPSTTPVVVFYLGFSRTRWALGPLPFALGPFGLPGCDLFIAPELPFPSLASRGTAQLSLPLPNDVSLVASRLFFQAFVPDPTANTAGLTVSNGLDAQLGIK